MVNLTSEQKVAININEPLILVSATAGSGKSLVLIERVKRLIRDGVNPRKIVILSYTCAAARNLRDRFVCEFCSGLGRVVPETFLACSGCNGTGCLPVVTGTLHSFCLALLRQDAALVGYEPQIQVLSDDERDELLAEIVAEQGYKGSMQLVKDVLKLGPDCPHLASLYPYLVVKSYWQKLRVMNAMDFDMVLQYGLRAIQQGAGVGQFDVLCVDEFQDVARIDMAIYKALPIPSKWFCGDFNQAIFSFRHLGEDPVHTTLELAREKTGVQKLGLHGNFRCARSIVAAAEALIPCGMQSVRDVEGEVYVKQLDDEEHELAFIANWIKDVVVHGAAINDHAVLCRYNVLVDFYAQGLRAAGIPVAARAQMPSDWGLAQKLISFMARPDDDRLAFAYLQSCESTEAAQRAKEQAVAKLTTINHDAFLTEGPIEASSCVSFLRESGISNDTCAAVEQLVAQLPPNHDHAAVLLSLREYELSAPSGEGVVVTTIHSMKSREAQTIIIPACEQSVMPGTRSGGDIAEERRVFYVALTRAQDTLILTHCKQRRNPFSGVVEEQVPSQFLKEMKLL